MVLIIDDTDKYKAALEVDADLVECGLNFFKLMPAACMLERVHLLMVHLDATLTGFIVVIKSLVISPLISLVPDK